VQGRVKKKLHQGASDGIRRVSKSEKKKLTSFFGGEVKGTYSKNLENVRG